ncbi:MAG: hypothetical protein WCY54_11170, partial [Syntrophales bacterium]
AAFLKSRIGGLKVGASRMTAETFRKPNAIRLIQALNAPFLEGVKDSGDLVFTGLEVDILL